MAEPKQAPPLSQTGPASGAKLLPIEQDMLARATGQKPFTGPGTWFGPGEPMTPQAPPDTKGRRLDYPFAVNTNPRPRGESGENFIDFPTLRRVSDPTQGGLDILRLAIETCKDRMAAQKWHIRGRDGKHGGDDAKRAMDLLAEPDGVNDFMAWQRLLNDDSLVIDHPVIYLRPTSKGYNLPEVMDGGTFKRILSESGRTPLPPLPAFAQQLKGMAAVEYTLEEVIVRPYNPRTHRIYPMSPVEQVVNIINLWLRRSLHQTEFYTAGTIPDGLLVGPEGLNPDQIQDFQNDWDSVLEGNTAGRRHGRWVPYGTQFLNTKQPDLTGGTDEWLARVVCWAFSLSPQALVKDQNRATAETGKATAQEEGLEPRKLWFKGVMDTVLRRAYGFKNLEFAWQDEEITDPKVKMEVWTGYKAGGIVTADEVREKALGMDPMSEEQKAEVDPPPPTLVALGDDPGELGAKPGTTQGKGAESASRLSPAKSPAAKPAPKGDKAEKKKRGATGLKPIDRSRSAVAKVEKAITSIMLAYFAKQRGKAVRIALSRSSKVAKASMDDFTDLWDEKEREKLAAALEEQLATMVVDGASQGVDQVAYLLGAAKDELKAILEQANEEGIKWAAEHAAELVTQIEDTTREGIRNLVESALEDGLTNDDLADQISEFTGFNEERAGLIATTETAFADVQGNLTGWRASGVVEGKKWITGKDEVCEDCLALEGKVVQLDDTFDCGGDEVDGPPGHPRCRCDVVPVVMTQAEIDAETE